MSSQAEDGVFFETSALIEFIFWDRRTRTKITDLFPSDSKKVTSRYVIYEVCRGFLNNLRLLHNKSLQVAEFSELFAYAAHCQKAGHKLGTILGAFEAFFRQPTAYEASSQHEQLCEFRGNLRRKIRRGFNALEGEMDNIINDVRCRDDFGPPVEDADGYFQHDLRTRDCGRETNCGLRFYYHKHRADFETIRDALDRSLDAETQRRWVALRELYRVKGRDFDRSYCYDASDATITHEAPHGTTVLSKNEKHVAPVATALGKDGIFYV
jgi:hypothetical protein